MKNFLQIFSLFVASTVFAQKISDYKYISIPQEFADAKANKYNLNQLLSKTLKSKKYVIVNESNYPNNPCDALKTEVLNTSNIFTNKIKVQFKNCNNVVVSSVDGKSFIKEFEAGMRDALENALKEISASNPVEKIVEVNTKPNEVVEKVVVTENSILKTEVKASAQNKAEVYTNGSLTLNRINISANQFILANPNTSVPYAIFNASAKKDVFRVQLENGNQTLGYLEDGKIVIEIPNSDGSFRKEVFSLK